MDRSQLLFALVDFFCEPFQNYKRYKGVARERDILFSDADPKYCKTDFYYKKNLVGTKKLPILVNVHGGGFVKGGKSHRKSLCSRYASEGWFVVNTDYRLAPDYAYPAALEDLSALLNRLPEWAEKYSLDLNKIVLTGDSAGAYYSSHLAAAMTNETLKEGLGLPDVSVGISAVMSFSGAYNIEKAIDQKLPFGMTRVIGSDLLGMKLKKDFSNLSEYPLLNYLNTTDYVTEAFPKTFLTYAKQDFFVSGQGETFAAKLKECGVPVTVDSTTKFFDNHCYHLTFFTKASKRCMKKVSEFLKEIADE